jgi:hypothetical protein
LGDGLLFYWGRNGSIASRSLNGAKCFLPFITDFPRFLGIYTIQSKDGAFGKFKEFESLAENESKKRIKCMKIDGREDYTGSELKTFLISHGISW